MVRYLLFFLMMTQLFAHGINYKVLKDGAYGFEAKYSDGSIMNFCSVKIMDHLGKSFQQGRTDRNGYFFFRPDGHGVWRVSVDDEMGHLLKFSLEIDQDLNVEIISAPKDPKWKSALMGLSVLFGLFGLVVLFNRRKKL